MNLSDIPSATRPEDMARCRAWTAGFLSDPARLPISFRVDGRPCSGIPESWNPTTTRRRIDAVLVETVFEGRDPRTHLELRVECLLYRDFPALEWTVWFTNRGSAPTPVVRDVLCMDGTFAGASPVLHHSNGDFCSAEGYTPRETPVSPGDTLAFAPNGGRPCDGAFPYYRIAFQGYGLTMAIGWPGQWRAEFQGTGEGVRVRAGQERIHARLMPGEVVRTPRMTLLAWTGDVARSVNLWRRWYLTHVLPRPDGRPMQPLLACCGTDDGAEFTGATGQNQVRYIDKARKVGLSFDVWWVDAGWYPCYGPKGQREWPVTGTWKPDPERFPEGLKPASERAAGHGANLLVWFEPERVVAGTELDTEHGDWLLRKEGSDNRLLHLGIPECRQWLTDRVCDLVRDNGIGIYRQDFNFQPLDYWRGNEDPDRQGMNENLHVQGYLRFWDDLLARNPGLWIDSCSSGGRRNDLETMRRSVPLHYTDYGYGDHHVKLAFHRTLYEWIPYFKECTLSWDAGKRDRFDNQVDRFSFHCGMAPMLFATVDIRRDDYDYPLAAAMIGVWRRVSDLMLHGDYYPLTPFHRDPAGWVARQFDCPKTGRGFLQAIRLPEAPEETLVLRPRGILPDAAYDLENPETGETRRLSGADLTRDGFSLALPKRSGAIWIYRRRDPAEISR